MSNQALALKLRKAVEDTDLHTIHEEIFSPNVESIEPAFSALPHAKGLDEVKKKAQLFGGQIKEMHSKSVSAEVVVAGDWISLGMSFDYTDVDENHVQMSELINYKVSDGKVVLEQFTY